MGKLFVQEADQESLKRQRHRIAVDMTPIPLQSDEEEAAPGEPEDSGGAQGGDEAREGDQEALLNTGARPKRLLTKIFKKKK